MVQRGPRTGTSAGGPVVVMMFPVGRANLKSVHLSPVILGWDFETAAAEIRRDHPSRAVSTTFAPIVIWPGIAGDLSGIPELKQRL